MLIKRRNTTRRVKLSEIKLENLPRHKLMSMCKEKEIQTKNTDKKKDLIFMLKSGETTHKPREVKRAPILTPRKEKIVPILPEEIMPELENLVAKGLKWEIDEESGCVNFINVVPVCCNLDSTAANILASARASFGLRSRVTSDKQDFRA